MKRVMMSVHAMLLFLALVGAAVAADMVVGTITKVENAGRSIVVKTKSGKEVNVRISGSRTKIEGIGDRSEFKEGQKVSAEMSKNSARRIKVAP